MNMNIQGSKSLWKVTPKNRCIIYALIEQPFYSDGIMVKNQIRVQLHRGQIRETKARSFSLCSAHQAILSLHYFHHSLRQREILNAEGTNLC